jgi:hypothetical protein
MPDSRADGTVRDIRQVLAIAGLPEARSEDSAGGYTLTASARHVRIMWWTENRFYDQAQSINLGHPQHPMARLGRDVTAAMERAAADVLYAAGFTVVLRPGVPNSNPEKERAPEVIVTAGPEFRAWADS